MKRSAAATTGHRTLSEVISRMSSLRSVVGILSGGSEAAQSRLPVSNYDVVVVLNEMPARLQFGLTEVQRRLTDMLFSLYEVWQGYSLVQAIPWHADKDVLERRWNSGIRLLERMSTGVERAALPSIDLVGTGVSSRVSTRG